MHSVVDLEIWSHLCTWTEVLPSPCSAKHYGLGIFQPSQSLALALNVQFLLSVPPAENYSSVQVMTEVDISPRPNKSADIFEIMMDKYDGQSST